MEANQEKSEAYGSGEGPSRRRRAAEIIESRKAWRKRLLWALGGAGGLAALATLLTLLAAAGRG